MKHLIRLLAVTLSIAITQSISAQSFGVIGGLNLSKMLLKDMYENYSSEASMKTGFHAGVTMDVPLSNVFSVDAMLLIESKGYLYKESAFGFSTESRINTLYLDLPIRLKGRYHINEDIAVYGAAGPYVGFGLSGKFRSEITFNGDTEVDEEDIEWGNDPDEDDLKRFDFGLSFGAGVEYSAFMLGVSYDLGLTNISAYTEDDAMVKTRVLRISLGYRFGGSAKSSASE